MTLDIENNGHAHLVQRRPLTSLCESFDETEEFEGLSPDSRPTYHNRIKLAQRMNVLRSSSLMGRKRFSSLNRSCDSTESSNSSGRGGQELPSKSTYRILFLGASNSGKTSIVRQFLYDQWSPLHKETMDDMYRGEFEDAQGKTINFDIQDVGGNFVYEFPAMKSVSLASADAFVLVFSLENAPSWDEVSRLRDMVIEAKDPDVPIVIVANKSDMNPDSDLPLESLEATAIFDWENGYVEASAKESTNINKIFRELLNQAKSRFDVSITSPSKTGTFTNSASVARHLPGLAALHQKAVIAEEKTLKRRQSLPAVPAGMTSTIRGQIDKIEEDEVFNSPKNRRKSTRRSSLANLRRDSCKIS